MGFINRLMGNIEKPRALKVAVIGEGLEHERLSAAYREVFFCPAFECEDGPPACPAEDDAVIVASPAEAEDAIRARGLMAAEVSLAGEEGARIAEECVSAGLFTSVGPPSDLGDLERLAGLARAHSVGLRIRLLPFYYPPYRELKRLVDDDAVGMPVSLKLAVRAGRGAETKDDARGWLKKDIGFAALAPWLMGPITDVHARLAGPGSSSVAWRHRARHRFGYLQIDFCPDLHVRTEHEPVHREIEFTGIGGVIMATRGEGQLLRLPALIVRGKSTTTAFEMVPDKWSEAYLALARETALLRAGTPRVEHTVEATRQALRLIDAAIQSGGTGEEVSLG